MASVMSTMSSTFQEDVLDQDQLVLVDFWAPWCSYCNKLTPLLDELAQEFDGKVKIVKINVDENKTLAQTHSIMSLPTMMLFKDGVAVEKIVGFVPKTNIAAKIQSAL
ncbi:MAG TPA: thioredoxin [Patescibacteria group bacterium]|nr:thioredoxin [Patescibacteria group bacterium]